MTNQNQLYFPDATKKKPWGGDVYMLTTIKFNPLTETGDAFDEAKKIFKEHFGVDMEVGYQGWNGYIRSYRRIKEQFLLRLPNGRPIPSELIDFNPDDKDDEVNNILVEIMRLKASLDKETDEHKKRAILREMHRLKTQLKS